MAGAGDAAPFKQLDIILISELDLSLSFSAKFKALRRRTTRPLRAPEASGSVCRRGVSSPRKNSVLFWSNLNFALGAVDPEPQRIKFWLLVLEAKKIPHVFKVRSRQIYVPPQVADIALKEISEFEQERPMLPAFTQVGYNNWIWVLLFMAGLVFLDALRHGQVFCPPAFGPQVSDDWLRLGGLDVAKVAEQSEWWRVFTAMTLHSDAAHLLGNCLFGTIFLVALCRYTGFGAGLFLTIFGGALGNFADVALSVSLFVSIGFSTAVFAALGALGMALACAHLRLHWLRQQFEPGRELYPGTLSRRELWIPLAAGLAFLALMGGSGEEHVNFAAHVYGLVGGALLTLICNVPLMVSFLLAPRSLAKSGAVGAGLQRWASQILSPAGDRVFSAALMAQGAYFALAVGALVLSWGIAWGMG